MSSKEKFPLYLPPEKKAQLERRYTTDGSRSTTGFSENASDGRLDQFESRMASLLFKQAVELDMGLSTLADCINLDDAYLRRRRASSIQNVKRTNGRLRFEQIARDARDDGSDDEWQD